jgi:hypothetical protein
VAAHEFVLADVVVACYKDPAVLGALLGDKDQVGKAQPVAVDRNPHDAAYSAADMDSAGAAEDTALALGEGTVEGQVVHMGLVARIVGHSMDRLQVVHNHSLDPAEASAHSLGHVAQVDDGRIGCRLAAWVAPDNRMVDTHFGEDTAVVDANHTALGGIAGDAFH